jgi:hypothetical protein
MEQSVLSLIDRADGCRAADLVPKSSPFSQAHCTMETRTGQQGGKAPADTEARTRTLVGLSLSAFRLHHAERRQ